MEDPASFSVSQAAVATMHGTSRTLATSVNADCCIPAGLRLGPVPGTFKLGKYLSDRREPGPKKKVLGHSGFPSLAVRLPLLRSRKGIERKSGEKGYLLILQSRIIRLALECLITELDVGWVEGRTELSGNRL